MIPLEDALAPLEVYDVLYLIVIAMVWLRRGL
jgi:hypothetical protein